jgi:glycosyltransferase involved in cell wall biosynthesis
VWALGNDPSSWPTVSVVMPVRNEAGTLADAVGAVVTQDYPRAFEVCLAVAPSRDGTREVADQLAAEHPAVTVVDNPQGLTPTGLNAAIAATRGEVVVRVDAHAQLSDGYIAAAVHAMAATGAVNVGGVQEAVGATPFEDAVAAAMTSWMGTGGGKVHLGGAAGEVDTVYLGVFWRPALEAVGAFDDTLERNQDYELNIRLRHAGGVVWFDPALRVRYRPRGSWQALARQYYQYGWWKQVVTRRYPESVRARQVAPVAATVGLGVSLLAGRRRWARAVRAAYLGAVAVAAVGGSGGDPGRAARLAVVLPTMHLSWGSGFIASAASRRNN